jgi:hypothetical protein
VINNKKEMVKSKPHRSRKPWKSVNKQVGAITLQPSCLCAVSPVEGLKKRTKGEKGEGKQNKRMDKIGSGRCQD